MYLTDPYGIETLSLEEGHGKDPSAKKIREIIEKAKSGKLLGIFAETQFNVELLNLVAKELKTRNCHPGSSWNQCEKCSGILQRFAQSL